MASCNPATYSRATRSQSAIIYLAPLSTDPGNLISNHKFMCQNFNFLSQARFLWGASCIFFPFDSCVCNSIFFHNTSLLPIMHVFLFMCLQFNFHSQACFHWEPYHCFFRVIWFVSSSLGTVVLYAQELEDNHGFPW